jgi:hypothetical protein
MTEAFRLVEAWEAPALGGQFSTYTLDAQAMADA